MQTVTETLRRPGHHYHWSGYSWLLRDTERSKWALPGSNRRHPRCKRGALPAELKALTRRRAGASMLSEPAANSSAALSAETLRPSPTLTGMTNSVQGSS